MKRKVLSIMLGLCLTLAMTAMCPCSAYADEGFLGGLQDLVGTREVDELSGYENQYTSAYRPVLRDGETEPVPEQTTSEAIQNVVNRSNTVPWGTSDVSLLRGIRYFFGDGSVPMRDRLMVVAVCLVFAWWGIRKSKQVLIAAFRRGRLSI